MEKKNITLSDLKIKSFITSLISTDKLMGGQVCPEYSRALEYCVTAEHMGGCESTGNTDDPTGIFSINDPGCLPGDF